MEDDELAQIKARRLAEYQKMQGDGRSSKEQQDEIAQRQEEFKNNILIQVLDQPALARLKTIALTKPEKSKMVESIIVQMAQRGQIAGKIGEEQLKSLLERVSEQTHQETSVKFDRRRAALDSDDDL